MKIIFIVADEEGRTGKNGKVLMKLSEALN